MRMATTPSENSGEEDREGVEEAWVPTVEMENTNMEIWYQRPA